MSTPEEVQTCLVHTKSEHSVGGVWKGDRQIIEAEDF